MSCSSCENSIANGGTATPDQRAHRGREALYNGHLEEQAKSKTFSFSLSRGSRPASPPICLDCLRPQIVSFAGSASR
jgi:hypothetical protein